MTYDFVLYLGALDADLNTNNATSFAPALDATVNTLLVSSFRVVDGAVSRHFAIFTP